MAFAWKEAHLTILEKYRTHYKTAQFEDDRKRIAERAKKELRQNFDRTGLPKSLVQASHFRLYINTFANFISGDL
jgi:hypothetical protein